MPDASEALETTGLQLVALQKRPSKSLNKCLESVTHENDEYKFRDVKLKPPTLNADQFKRKQNILIESVLNHINKRIDDLDTNHLLRFMQIFYPANMPVTKAEEAVYGEDL